MDVQVWIIGWAFRVCHPSNGIVVPQVGIIPRTQSLVFQVKDCHMTLATFRLAKDGGGSDYLEVTGEGACGRIVCGGKNIGCNGWEKMPEGNLFVIRAFPIEDGLPCGLPTKYYSLIIS